jgi:hypothetical protein
LSLDIHFRLGFSEWLTQICMRHPQLVTDYTKDFAERAFTAPASKTAKRHARFPAGVSSTPWR